jgi:SAM-dependent methyltransferase
MDPCDCPRAARAVGTYPFDAPEEVDAHLRGTPAIGSGRAASGVAGRECPLCGERGTRIGAKEGVSLRLCCGSLLAWAWADEVEYEGWYEDPRAYPVLEQRANGQSPFVERVPEQVAAAHARLDTLTALYVPPDGSSMLDVGTGTGTFVEVAQRRCCCPVEGVEPCGALVYAAQARHLPIWRGDWRTVERRYAIITLFDVLEHLTRPFECLCHLRQRLEPGGVLVVEMPEWDSPHQRRQGLYWKHIRPRQHLWLPSRSAAETLFEWAGYDVMTFHRPLCGSLGKASWLLAPS